MEEEQVEQAQVATEQKPDKTVVDTANDFKSLRSHAKSLENDLRSLREQKEKDSLELAELRATLNTMQQFVPPVDREPTIEQFGNDPKLFAEALAAHKVSLQQMEATKKAREEREKSMNEMSRREMEQMQLQEEVAMLRETDPEFVTAIDAIQKNGVGAGISADVTNAITKSPYRLEILKHLGLNPEYTKSLEELPIRQQVIRLFALEQQAKAHNGSLAHLRVNRAPAPVPPKVAGNSGASRGTQSLANAGSISDFMAGFRDKLKNTR